MARVRKNILFIMFDQLRFDYLSCAGHPHLETPHMDAIAAKGVRFTNCYVQSPICGASRMCFYTGRYVQSHGAAWNNFPLKVGEQTMGDHLRKIGMETWLIGKTHMKVDDDGMKRLGISSGSIIGARIAECGFDTYVREDGLRPEGPDGFYDKKRSPYNAYLNAKGYDGDNPWHDYANSGIDNDGNMASGWFMEHASKPANIKEEDSETPYLTSKAIEFMEHQEINGAGPWMCHLSYIKPHWPYIVPKPYHDMYGANHVPAPVRHEKERENPHPIFEQFMNNPIGKAFSREEVRQSVIPAYMGLIKQCDDQMGRLFKFMEETGRMDDTMIVITSDHGDYLGDHWLGEKDLFHEQSAKIPMIIYDPSTDADAGRGTVCDDLTESIDLAPTFVDFAGGDIPDHILEGRSLLSILEGDKDANPREFAISEYDYSATGMAGNLGLAPRDARLFMVTDGRWKLMHAEGGFRPILFDLENDPQEFTDLGDSAAHDAVIEKMYQHLGTWARRMSQRTTRSEKDILSIRNSSSNRTGVLIGVYEADDVPENIKANYVGKARQNYLSE